VLAALAVPISLWWLSQMVPASSGPAAYAIALLPVLLLFRGYAGSTIASALTGVIVALCFVGIAGIGILLVPIGIATLILASRDLGQRSAPKLRSVAIAAAAFVATFTVTIVGSSLYYGRQ